MGARQPGGESTDALIQLSEASAKLRKIVLPDLALIVLNSNHPQTPNPDAGLFEARTQGGSRWSSGASPLLCPVFLSCLFFALTAATWRRWGDILIDLPLHLYTPWRLSLGEVLYKDVINLHGPLTETYHGVLFRLFGSSVSTLIGASLVLLAIQTALLYSFFKKEAGPWVATLIGGVFLAVFAFGHLTGIGNYNYILPYNYELIHGLFFSSCTLLWMRRWGEGRGAPQAGLAGLFFGFAILTKQEITLALTLAIATAFVLQAVRQKQIDWKSLVWFGAATMVGPGLFWAYFASHLGPKEALGILLWPWKALLSTTASENAFHRAGLGLDDPLENGAITFQSAGMGVLVFLVFTALCHRRVPKVGQYVGGMVLMALAWRFDWRDVGSGFPLLSLLLIPLLIWKGGGRIFPVLWAVFGLGLLAKMGINCRIWHYGYVLAMPAATGLIFALLKTLPDWLEEYGINGKMLRVLLAAAIGAGAFQLWADSWHFYRAKTALFGQGVDRVLTFPPNIDPRPEAIQLTVEWLKANTDPESTLAAFPQGVILNFLARRVNPTPYLTWIVTEYNTFGEERMLGSLKNHPPDYIALVHTDTSEYGPRFFGQPGYAADTARWIVSHYRPVFLAGNEPFRNERFGIRLLRYTGEQNR